MRIREEPLRRVTEAIVRHAGSAEPILLDMATSKIALGKARVAMNKGQPLPEGELIDHQGKPTDDPRVMFGESERGRCFRSGPTRATDWPSPANCWPACSPGVGRSSRGTSGAARS